MGQRYGRFFLVILAAAALVTAASPAPVAAQRAEHVEVTSGGERVVVDGELVRIESGGTVTEVSGDWRSAGTVYVTGDTERILAELGAVTVDDRIQLNLAGDILFDFDSSAIRPDAAAQLAKAAHVIRDRAVGEVHLIGHTDSIGDDAYNQRLSRERAVAVMSWLNRVEGIPTAVMVGSGMGASRPVAHNTRPDGSDDPAGRARNRRVEIQMATREGVAVGPGVIIGPGAVRVSEQGVTVGGGAIQVDAGGVRVGGVTVDAGGVTVAGGGVRVDTGAVRTVGYELPSICPTGETCTYSCIEGDCRMSCRPGSICTFSCPGGDCTMECESGAECSFSCAGGDCLFDCAGSADCRRISCTGDDCVCTGAGC